MTTQAASKIITFDNILFATDFSKESNVALSFALSIAHKYGIQDFCDARDRTAAPGKLSDD